MTITGRFPVLKRASAKMRARLGVRLGEMQPERKTGEPIDAISTTNPARVEIRFDRQRQAEMQALNL
jgi:hypothetical protein